MRTRCGMKDKPKITSLYESLYKPVKPGSNEEAFLRLRARFRGKVFDLEETNRIRGFRAWKISNKRLMNERDGITETPPPKVDPPLSLEAYRKQRA